MFCFCFFKTNSAYEHSNTYLLCDRLFQDSFEGVLGVGLRSRKSSFQTVQQWWDFAKIQIRQLCQQHTFNVTRDRKSTIE